MILIIKYVVSFRLAFSTKMWREWNPKWIKIIFLFNMAGVDLNYKIKSIMFCCQRQQNTWKKCSDALFEVRKNGQEFIFLCAYEMLFAYLL